MFPLQVLLTTLPPPWNECTSAVYLGVPCFELIVWVVAFEEWVLLPAVFQVTCHPALGLCSLELHLSVCSSSVVINGIISSTHISELVGVKCPKYVKIYLLYQYMFVVNIWKL